MSSFDAQSFYLAGVVPNNYMQRRGSTPPDSPRVISQPIDFVSSIPPSVTRLLTYCTPAIHLSFYLLKLITWQGVNGRESLLLLAAWSFVCLWVRELIVYGTTWILVMWIGWNWIQRRKRERLGKTAQSVALPSSATSTDLNRTLAELELVVDYIGVLHRAAATTLARLDWSDRTETEIILNMALYTYLPWLALAYLVPLRYMILLTGSLLICWSSPWMRVIRMAIARSALMQYLMQTAIEWIISLGAPRGWRGIPSRQFSVRGLIQRAKEEQKRVLTGKAQNQEEDKSEASGSKLKGADLIFRFVIYENQRWWLGLDWTTNMMPNERAPWTDEYDEPTPPKSRFTLPPPTHTITPHPTDPTMQIRKTMSWTWLDQDWWPDMEANVDKEGWEYGHGGWKQYSSKSGSVQAYVRRRKWIRTARLVEQVEKIKAGVVPEVEKEKEKEKEKEEEESSVEAIKLGTKESRRKAVYHEEPESMEGGGENSKKSKGREGAGTELKRGDSRKVISS
ncbi:integral peroxisomal membrane peroxin-domain-containing protein [Endogone sp. FLAS-F59071]|nr:integral peroxisomal membrane peroxin-domain-containing protein [Endogone sp. FLAS-F59071]|eukprot:RUS21969.1 integral peroxisomal membrane peroxin-domain-containing protein [Endogone sp. FLAS-F59071]